MAKDGVIAVNVTNRYLDLHPIVHRIAKELGYEVAFVMTPEVKERTIAEAHWVLLSRNGEIFNHPIVSQVAERPQGTPRVSLWTDEYASVREVMR